MVGVVERHSGKKRATGKKGGWEYFYAQENSICQLLRDGKIGWETIGGSFFSKKNKDGEERLETLREL